MGTDEPKVLVHYYVSTACHHEEHGRCRLTCKFCPSKCLCLCHASSMSLEADTWTVTAVYG